MKKLQFLALDNPSQSALESASLDKASLKSKIAISQLEATCESEYQQIVIVSSLDIELANKLYLNLKDVNRPMLIYPAEEDMSDAVKLLLISNILLIPIKNSSLLKMDICESIEALDSLLLTSHNKDDINLEEVDFEYIIQAGVLNYLHIATATDTFQALNKIINRPKVKFFKSKLVLVTLTIDKDTSYSEFTKELETLYLKVNSECDLLYQIRKKQSSEHQVKIALLQSVKIDMVGIFQVEIERCETYMEKMAVIIDNFYIGYLTADEANTLAINNQLFLSDVNSFYSLIYKKDEVTIKLMENLRTTEDKAEQIKFIAKVLHEGVVVYAFIEEICSIYTIDIQDVVSVAERLVSENTE